MSSPDEEIVSDCIRPLTAMIAVIVGQHCNPCSRWVSYPRSVDLICTSENSR
jgi:uncharacterized OB-fold protein